jgi:hypothetical protein
LGHDRDGDEVSTLVVDDVGRADAPATKSAPARTIPASRRLLMSVLKNALIDHGILCRPLTNGPEVRAVAERHVRVEYFKGIAEDARADEGADKLYDRQDKSFRRAAKSALDGQTDIPGHCPGMSVGKDGQDRTSPFRGVRECPFPNFVVC